MKTKKRLNNIKNNLGNSSVVDSFKMTLIISHIIILEPILEYIRNQK